MTDYLHADLMGTRVRHSSGIELRHLRTFLAVAETENFTRAAERLGMTQPAISQQVKELESALQTPLFQRMGTRVRLTQAGERFRQRAATVMVKFSYACTPLEVIDGALSGHLHVGVIPPLNVSWMPRVMAILARDHPGIAITTTELSTGDVEMAVESGQVDVGIGILSNASPNIRSERIREDRMVLLVPPGPFRSLQSGLRLRDLATIRLVMPPVTYLMRHMVDESMRREQVRPRVMYEIDTIDALLATSIQTGVPTVLPRVVLDARTELDLIPLTIGDWEHSIEYGLIWPNSKDQSAMAEVFARVVREVAINIQ